MSDQAEIITRPPSHPLATSLLGASILGTIGAIAFVWMELFGEYMPAPQPGAPLSDWESKHNPVTLASKEGQAVHDHYKIDFSDNGETLSAIEAELGVSSNVGDPTLPADSGGGGESPPAETPPPSGEAPAGEAPAGETPPVEEPGGEEGGG